MIPKVILISQFPLPYSKIGSWTTMYKKYLEGYHKIDFIVCPEPENLFPNVDYSYVSSSFKMKFLKKVTKNRYLGYFKALEQIIEPNQKYIIQIIDNFGIVKPINDFLLNKQLRKLCYLQFFYHGFPPFHENFHGRWFYETIDEMILLTQDSYQAHKNYYTVLPCQFNILHNGVNSSQFYPLKSIEKTSLRKKIKVQENKLIFIWCSKDRPKKGLDLILKVWKLLIEKNNDIELWVIGNDRIIDLKQVKNIGRVPNNELAKYYQLADFYLFTSLCHEGFGLTLAEALKCGCYCIASNNGGIPEVLNYGQYGKLIENPNFIDEWIEEIENSILEYTNNGNNNPYLESLPNNLYGLEEWCLKMNLIIDNTKKLIK
jgi:L-malate glycosyltransferase